MGLISLLIRAANSPELLPDALFYSALVLHTYFSVRFFSRVIPQNSWQSGTDLALVAVYFGLALSLGDGFRFLFLAPCLFALAISKYTPSLGKPHLAALMRRKIKYLAGGIALVAYSMIIASLVNQAFAAWFMFIVYAAFTFHILFNERMYDINSLPQQCG